MTVKTLAFIGSDDSLSPLQHQIIILTTAHPRSIKLLGTKFNFIQDNELRPKRGHFVWVSVCWCIYLRMDYIFLQKQTQADEPELLNVHYK